MVNGMFRNARLAELKDKIERERAVSPELMSEVLDVVEAKMPGISAKRRRIDRWIGVGAWTEATFALVEIALPQWRLRRLAHEQGVWRCCLSKQWNVPDWLSDNAEACHASPTLAILGAMIEANLCAETSTNFGSVPRCPMASDCSVVSVNCDNFA